MTTRNIPIIAITGSAGKTTTKELIAGILSRRWNIVKTNQNFNLPDSTLKNKKKIKSSTNAAVLEYAMALPSDLIKHCKVLQPSISIITNIGSAHIGLSSSNVQQLAKNKSNIILGMRKDGLLLTNADDDNSAYLLTKQHTGKLLSVSIDKPSNYQAKNVTVFAKGSKFDVEIRNKTYRFTLNLLGRHNIYNALFAIAVADSLGFNASDIQLGMNDAYNNHLKRASRLSVYELQNNIAVIDDTKNSNPHACRAAIDAILQMQTEQYIAVFGDMRHLGRFTAKGHYQVGQYAAKKGIHMLVLFGKYAKYTAEGAIENGMSKEKIIMFSSRGKLNQYLSRLIKGNSVVLVKGSGAEKMSLTVNYLLKSLK